MKTFTFSRVVLAAISVGTLVFAIGATDEKIEHIVHWGRKAGRRLLDDSQKELSDGESERGGTQSL